MVSYLLPSASIISSKSTDHILSNADITRRLRMEEEASQCLEKDVPNCLHVVMHCPETKDKQRLEGKSRLDTYYKHSEILLNMVQNHSPISGTEPIDRRICPSVCRKVCTPMLPSVAESSSISG